MFVVQTQFIILFLIRKKHEVVEWSKIKNVLYGVQCWVTSKSYGAYRVALNTTVHITVHVGHVTGMVNIIEYCRQYLMTCLVKALNFMRVQFPRLVRGDLNFVGIQFLPTMELSRN